MTKYIISFIKLFSILLFMAALCASRGLAANPMPVIDSENTARTRSQDYVALLETDGPTAGATSQEAERMAPWVIDRQQLFSHRLSLPQTTTPAWTTGIITDTAVAEMIDQVSETEVYSLTGGLSGEWPVTIGGSLYTIQDRNTGSNVSIQKATQYISETFAAHNLSPIFHEWQTSGYSGRNVIGEITGESRPDDVFLITAHLDNMPTVTESNPFAPGADDNASGSVAVLVAAQILSQYDWDCTLRFASFTGEEQGKLGSLQYAEMASYRGDNILGVLNLDMIGYNSDEDPAIDLHIRSGEAGDLAIANLFTDVISAYDLDLNPEIVSSGISASDHASFWYYGYPAILAIEDYAYPDRDFNPYYHTTDDTLVNLDLTYFTSYVKAAVGTFAHMGCLTESHGGLAGTVTDAATSDPVSGASIKAVNAFGQEWSTETDIEGSYEINLPSGNYSVSAVAQSYSPLYVSGIQVTRNLTPTLDLTILPNRAYLPLVIQTGL
jgi:Zn-dependent M28 family amino/carboxypeptidase